MKKSKKADDQLKKASLNTAKSTTIKEKVIEPEANKWEARDRT